MGFVYPCLQLNKYNNKNRQAPFFLISYCILKVGYKKQDILCLDKRQSEISANAPHLAALGEEQHSVTLLVPDFKQ